MDVFGKGTEEGTRPLLSPGVCWICDMSPTQEEMRVIDTHRNSRPGFSAIAQSERKYICEPCAVEMGGAMGMVKADEHTAVAEQATEWQNQAATFAAELEAERERKVRVVAADEIADVISATVRDELAKQVKPAPRAKAPAKPKPDVPPSE